MSIIDDEKYANIKAHKKGIKMKRILNNLRNELPNYIDMLIGQEING